MLQRAKSVKLSELVNRKLENPNLELNADEQLDVLRECIERGAAHAETAAGQDLLAIIGNTGAGKSTCVNYVDGCKLEKISRDVAAGAVAAPAGGGGKKVVRVAPDSPRPELMRIGHSNKSQTFVPDVRVGHEFVYSDCPGFLDNRGAEINIANAVNIKATVSRAKSTKVLVLLNYDSLRADRGRGLRELGEILVSLFGSAEGLQKHRGSIALGVSRVPKWDDDGDNTIELENVRADHFSELAGLPSGCREVVEVLQPTLFLFSPHDKGNTTWLTRDQMVRMLRDLDAIQDSSDIFKTVLNADDEKALRRMCAHLVARGEGQLESGDYTGLCDTLRQIASLRMVGSGYVSELLAEALSKVRGRGWDGRTRVPFHVFA